MSISIKNVNVAQAKERISELFGDLSPSDIGVVKLNDNDTKDKKADTEIAITNIQELRKKIQSNFGKEITSNDVGVVKVNDNVNNNANNNTDNSFNISTCSISDLKNKLEESGFSLEGLDVAVVTAQDLNSENKTKNGNGKKFKN